MLASLRGIAVRGPMIGAQHAYVHVRDWLGEPPPEPEPDVALAWLARRYLAGHGPASDRDLAKWAGIPLGQARLGLAAIAAELADRPDGLAELRGGARDAGLPPPLLLGPFDPLLLGWAAREPILGERQEIVTSNGLFRPFALVDGVAAGMWAWTDGRVVLERWGRLPELAESALAAEARDVRRYLVAGLSPSVRSMPSPSHPVLTMPVSRRNAVKLPDLSDLPFAAALDRHDGELTPDGDYDTLLFERAEFDAPDAPNARFLDCALRQVSVTGGRLPRANLRSVWMRDVRLTGTDIAESGWHDVTVIGSSLAGLQVFGSELRQVVFSGCKLDSVNFRAARLTHVTFDNCVLRDVDFAGATLGQCSFPGSELVRADFSKVTMDRTDLRGAVLGVTIDTGSLRGAIISSGQLALAAPVLAQALGIIVDDAPP